MINRSNFIRILSKYGWPVTVIILASLAVGSTWSSSDELYDNIRLFDRVALMVSSNYIEDIDETKLIRSGIDGMLSGLDQYSKFLDGPDFLYLKQETDGQFDGIGVGLELHHDTLTVVSVQENAPAAHNGLKTADRIISIDNKPIIGKNIKEIKMLLRGPAGSTVKIKIDRPNKGELVLEVARDRVEIKAVNISEMIDENIGYIRLAKFSEGCSIEMKKAIRELKKKGMKSLILDLRGNPGGLLIEAVEIAGIFLPDNTDIVETRGKNDSITSIYSSTGFPIFPFGSLAILVDGQTASAAEIVAGTLQDHDRGVIIGSATYGKGLVQQVLQFSDDSALKLTTAKYYLPSGRCLQKPDWSSFELLDNPNDQPSDSLYLTDSGRPVIGGGGIIPDIFIESENNTPYVDSLIRGSLFFDFACEYDDSHKVDSRFKVSESVIDDFKNFLVKRGFKYCDDRRQSLNRLEQGLNNSSSDVMKALQTIDAKINSIELHQFDSNRSLIARHLHDSIVSISIGENALYDPDYVITQPEMKNALEILSDSKKYADVLVSR